MHARVIVLGLGNVLVGDDAFGPFVVHMLDAAHIMAPGVEVLDAGTPGLDLAPHLAGAHAAIIVDTVTGAEPGAIRWYRKHELFARQPLPRTNPHQPGLVDTLLLLDLQDLAPEEVLLIGAVPAQYVTGAPLSAPLRAAADRVIQLVLTELERLGCPALPRAEPCEPDIWWERSARLTVTTEA